MCTSMVSEAEKAERAADILFPQPGNLYVGQHAASGLGIYSAAHGKPLRSGIRGNYQVFSAELLAESAYSERYRAVRPVS